MFLFFSSTKKKIFGIFSLFISFDLQMKIFSITMGLFLFNWVIMFNNNNFFINSKTLKMLTEIFLKKEIKINSFFKNNLNNNYLLFLFFIIVNMNLMGLMPLSFTLSAHLFFVCSLAITFWVGLNLFNLTKKSKKTISHLVPQGSPMALSQFMVIIETISNLIRPLTLSIRLVANLTAGHLIMTLCSNTFLIISLLDFPLLLINILEIMVSLIQAYVFMTLISMYSGEI